MARPVFPQRALGGMKGATEGLSEGTFRRIPEPWLLAGKHIGEGVAGSKRPTKNFVLERGASISETVDEFALDCVFKNDPAHADRGCNDEINPAGVVGRRFEMLAWIFVAGVQAAAGDVGAAAFVANGGFAEDGTDFEISLESSSPCHGFQAAIPVRRGFSESRRATLGIIV